MDDKTLASWRRDYTAKGLSKSDLLTDPVAQLQQWLTEAELAGIPEPNAMVLCTVDDDDQPSSRTVLLKGMSIAGLVFYTNYRSRKGVALVHQPRCALLFPWHALQRQVRIEGDAEPVPAPVSDAYFASRPRGAQLGAWASPQSTVVSARSVLQQEYDETAARWPDGVVVPRPEHWGGYVVRPHAMEFWQGRADRMHDRLRYRRDDGGWVIERLAP